MDAKNFAGGRGKTTTEQLMATLNSGHAGVTTSINQAGVPDAFECLMRESRKINAGDTSHHLIMGKTRDGMGGFAQSMPEHSGSSRATGLLAGLLCRI